MIFSLFSASLSTRETLFLRKLLNEGNLEDGEADSVNSGVEKKYDRKTESEPGELHLLLDIFTFVIQEILQFILTFLLIATQNILPNADPLSSRKLYYFLIFGQHLIVKELI